MKFEDCRDLCKHGILVVREKKNSTVQPVRWSWPAEDRLGVGLG